MYYLITAEEFVRVPPERLGDKIEDVIFSELEKELSEKVIEIDNEHKGSIVAIEKIESIGEGRMIQDDGGVYFNVKFTGIADVPVNLEFVKGFVKSIRDYGVFVDLGTFDGLCHISQIFDDYCDYDFKNQMIIGKTTGKKLMTGNEVKARIITISWKDNIYTTKIGLTMRQPYLGRDEWIEVDEKKKEKKDESKEKQKKEKINKDG